MMDHKLVRTMQAEFKMYQCPRADLMLEMSDIEIVC